MKKLAEILSEETVKVSLVGASRDEVIKELLEVLDANSPFQDKKEIFKAVLEREHIMTTGVGNGIAIPHCKHDQCEDFALALGTTHDNIEFQAVDQNPVHIVFLLVGPKSAAGMHIKILSRITRILSNPDVREKILNINNSKELYHFLIGEEEKTFN
jgi:fructose-specific phosphotransferase system IIA component